MYETPRLDKPWQFQPGQSGNPAGRPKLGDAWTDILREYGEMTVKELRQLARHIDDLPSKRATALRQVLEGIPQGKGSASAGRLSVASQNRKITYERVDGKPIAIVDHRLRKYSLPLYTDVIRRPVAHSDQMAGLPARRSNGNGNGPRQALRHCPPLNIAVPHRTFAR